MDKQTCQTCIHFHQHYTLKTGKLLRVFYGHCTFCGAKAKDPLRAACKNYENAPPDEDAFASKNFLTKELIKKLFEMEILPPIENEQFTRNQ